MPTRRHSCAQVELPRTEPKLLTNRGPWLEASPLGTASGPRRGHQLAREGGSLVLHLAVAVTVILCAPRGRPWDTGAGAGAGAGAVQERRVDRWI